MSLRGFAADRSIRLCIMSITAALVTATVAGQTSDWNTGPGGGASRNCLSAEVGPTAPELLWQGSLPAIVSQQAVIEGNVMVVARIANFNIPDGTTIVAHDLHTGEMLWDTQLPFNNPDEWRSRVSAIRDGQVYATRAGNTNLAPLYALHVKDGSIIWGSEDPIGESTTEGLAFAPNGDPIVGNFSSVMRIDKTDGTTVWETARSCPTSNGCLVSVFGDRAYYWEASGQGPKVTALNITDGAVLYSSDGIGGGFIEQLGLFVGLDGTVYAPRTQNNPVTDFFVALQDTGKGLVEQWSVPMGFTPFGTMGVGPDGSVYSYLTDNDNALFTIVRLDPADGELVDESEPLQFDFPLTPRMAIDANGKVFVTNGGFQSGALFSFDADLTSRWSVKITNVNLGGPAIGKDGILIVCGVGSDVRAYQRTILGDLDGDGYVGVSDLLILLGSWGPCPDLPETCPADLDLDGTVGVADLLILLSNWG